MNKVLVLLALVLGVFVYLNRERLYVRDPLAGVTRDGVAQSDVWVMINAANDVLMQDNSGGHHRLYLVQGWNKTPGLPPMLQCLTGMVCMTDADHATTSEIPAGPRGKRPPFAGVTMSSTAVEFLDEHGALVHVSLR